MQKQEAVTQRGVGSKANEAVTCRKPDALDAAASSALVIGLSFPCHVSGWALKTGYTSAVLCVP